MSPLCRTSFSPMKNIMPTRRKESRPDT
jgi:hypothetical protein